MSTTTEEFDTTGFYVPFADPAEVERAEATLPGLALAGAELVTVSVHLSRARDAYTAVAVEQGEIPSDLSRSERDDADYHVAAIRRHLSDLERVLAAPAARYAHARLSQ